MSEPTIVIGAYYALPDGTVARTGGWDAASRRVSYRLDDDHGDRSASEAEVLDGWTLRRDLADYPNARDPALPFVFDLKWDAKRRSDLIPLLADDGHAEEVAAAMAEHGIELTGAEREGVECLRGAAAFAGM